MAKFLEQRCRTLEAEDVAMARCAKVRVQDFYCCPLRAALARLGDSAFVENVSERAIACGTASLIIAAAVGGGITASRATISLPRKEAQSSLSIEEPVCCVYKGVFGVGAYVSSSG